MSNKVGRASDHGRTNVGRCVNKHTKLLMNGLVLCKKHAFSVWSDGQTIVRPLVRYFTHLFCKFSLNLMKDKAFTCGSRAAICVEKISNPHTY